MLSTYHRLSLGSALWILWICPLVAAEATQPDLGIRDKTPSITAFTNARVVISPDQTIADATLIVREGRVESVTAAGLPPEDAVLFDLSGKTIYPGFVEAYAEYGLAAVGTLNEHEHRDAPVYEGRRRGPNSWNEAIHSERHWINQFEPDAEQAKALLERGVTTVHSTKMDGVFRGRGFVTTLEQGLANDTVVQARGLHSASFNKGSSQQPYPNSLMGTIALVRQTFLDSQWYSQAHGRTDDLRTNTALQALSENNQPILFDTRDELTLLRASRIAKEMDVEFLYLGSNEEYLHLDSIKALGPSLLLPLDFPDQPEVGTLEAELDISLAELRHWERAPSNPAILEEAELTFALTGHGLEDSSKFLPNLQLAVDRGLSVSKALAGLTTEPAAMLGITKQVGTLQPGRLANLVITDGDLFTEGTEILEVWVRGEPALSNRSLDPIEISGLYQFEIDGEIYSLNLTRASGSLEGSVSLGEKKTVLDEVTDAGSRVTFQIPWSQSEPLRVARFSLDLIGGGLFGSAALPDGSKHSFSADLKPEEPIENSQSEDLPPKDYVSQAEDEASEPLGLVSRVTHPPLPRGFEEPPSPETILVRNATIWTSDEAGILENADLLVRDGQIAAVGTNIQAPAGTRVVDGTGKHVTPGIIDEHSHIAISRGVNEGSHAVTSEVRIGDVVNPDHGRYLPCLGRRCYDDPTAPRLGKPYRRSGADPETPVGAVGRKTEVPRSSRKHQVRPRREREAVQLGRRLPSSLSADSDGCGIDHARRFSRRGRVRTRVGRVPKAGR